jgi:ABC-2 type transport system ATP-binding protein
VIRAEGLGKQFGERWAVRDLTIEVGAGEIFGFLGPNGAGKTTTTRMLAGMIAPTEGRAWIAGFDMAGSPDDLRSRIGLLTETPGLYERMSAAANLDYYGKLHGLPTAKRRERVRACLDLLGLWERRNDQVAGFSKGMKQKLAIARTVLHEPVAVFLDEPTSGLDPEAARDVRSFILDLRDAGRAIFLCTHNLDEARRLCDRLAIFKGKVLRLGTSRDLEREVVRRRLAIRLAGPPGGYLALVKALPVSQGVEIGEGELVVLLDDLDRDTPLVVRALVEAGAAIQRVAGLDSALESAYLSIIGGEQIAGERSGGEQP